MAGDLMLKPLYDFWVSLHGRDARACTGLGHFDHLPVFHSPIASGRRLFADQLGGDPQRFYFLLDALDFLLFLPEYFKGILHGGLLVGRQNQLSVRH
jgi:hypothetical protein